MWTALITLPLMMAVQEICDRTALATGKTLGELARAHFGPWARACIGVLIVALVVANTLNIAADLVAIGSGMALPHAGPSWLWALSDLSERSSVSMNLALTGILCHWSFPICDRMCRKCGRWFSRRCRGRHVGGGRQNMIVMDRETAI